MKNTLYELLESHIGHRIEIVKYGDKNISVEDVDTNEGIFDTDIYDLVGHDERLIDADMLLEKSKEVTVYNELYGATYTGNVVYTDYIYDALKERYKDDYEREMGR